MKSWIITSYYTKNTFYKDLAMTFISSMNKFKIPHDVRPVENQGCWYKNTNHKPTFLLQMLEAHPDKNIIWVDCDAEFKNYPVLFDSLTCDLAAFEFSQAKYYKRTNSSLMELLSGTLFLQNNESTANIVKKWIEECKNNPKVWDQKSLQKVVGNDYHKLPGEYCCIHNRMTEIRNPVIVHYQASRRARKDKSLLNRARP